MKTKTIWMYLDGKRHTDVVQWALAANVTVSKAKEHFIMFYENYEVTFKVQ